MSVEILQELARSFYISGVVFSCVVLVLFFRFQIWKIIGDLSGFNAKRGVKAISKYERTMERYSQGFLGLESIRDEGTESFVYTKDTGVLMPKTEKGNYYVIEKMEYMASEKWIE